jgi:hypothetical protein
MVLRIKEAGVVAVTAAALREALSGDPDILRFHGWGQGLADAPVQLEPASYDARELWGFRVRALRHVFGGTVHRLDLDETEGVIRLGVADAGDISDVRRRVAAAGIPVDAVVIEVRPRADRQETLQDRLRPVPAGVQIDLEDAGGYCTLGVNAWMPESEAWRFLTCSHCTSVFGAANGEAAWQNEEGSGNFIAQEVLDPPLWDPGVGSCPSSGVIGCRYTDAAFYVYQSSSYPDSLTIARTTSSSGSYTIDANHPRFAVGGPDIEYPTESMEVHKIGRTTGWTTGEVTETCVDIEADDIVTFCSYVTDYESLGGDSGSPVFTWDGSSFSVELIGLHWGGFQGTEAYFSPWLFIQIEIEGELQEQLIYAY